MTGEPHRELIEGYYAAVGARDVEALAALVAPDVRWSSPASIPGGGIRIGTAAVLEGVGILFRTWPEVDVLLDQVTLDPRGASVRGRYLTPSGLEVPFSDQITVRDGRVVSIRSAYDGGALNRALKAREERLRSREEAP